MPRLPHRLGWLTREQLVPEMTQPATNETPPFRHSDASDSAEPAFSGRIKVNVCDQL